MKRHLGRPEVVVLGEALWDIFPTEPGASLRARRTEQRCLGGAPANVACTLARLGIDAAMICAVGDDALGEGIQDELARAGVDTARVTTVRARTGVTFIDLDASGTPRFLPYRSPSADMLLPESAADDLEIEWLYVGSSSFAGGSIARAATTAVSHAAHVAIDLNIYPSFFRDGTDALVELIPGAALLKASENDLRALGLSADRAGAEALHARRREHVTIATFAERGAIAWWGDLMVEAPPSRPEITIDATGAGDAFIAGVLATFVRSRDPADDRVDLLTRALSLGSALGARAISAIGATTALADLSAERAALARGPGVR